VARDFFRVENPKYLTRAVVVIDGMEYFEWTSVQVILRANGNPTAEFRLTVSEQEPLGDEFAAFRIKPPDKATIYLDGFKAIYGFVATRQVYYNATSHTVEIRGKGWDGRTGDMPSISQTGEFKNQNVLSIAKALAGKIGVNVKAAGNLPTFPIPRFNVQPGETVFESVEKLMRSIGGVFTSDADGNWILAGPGSGEGGNNLIEGYNIIEGRETIHSLMNVEQQQMVGQSPGNDDQSMSQVTQMLGKNSSKGAVAGLLQAGSQARSLMEIPGFAEALMKQRATHESNVSDSNAIYVWITHIGWQRPSGGLWRPLDNAFVDSPMLIMQRPLQVREVTFSQDSAGGTKTELTLMNQVAIGGPGQMTGGQQ
jgi:prophage tail gpP-like protein